MHHFGVKSIGPLHAAALCRNIGFKTIVVSIRLKVKLGGGSGAASAANSSKSDDDTAQDHWDAECADCGEEGNLLCCEVSFSAFLSRALLCCAVLC